MKFTWLLIVANIVFYALEHLVGDSLIAALALWPIGRFTDSELGASVGFRPWQLVTSAFLHGNVEHLGLNMLALYMFGRDVERLLGGRRYLELYGAAVLSAAITQLVFVTAAGSPTPTVGASGGVFGVLLAFGVLFPEQTVFLLFPPIPLPARVFVVVYGLLELAHGVLGTDAGVAHFAHLGGMLGAGLLLRRWRRHRARAL